MRIEPAILARHLHEAAIDQLVRQLESEGWTTARDVPLGAGRWRADLLARRDGTAIVYEVKSSSQEGGQAQGLARAARELGAGFRLVFVRPPRTIRAEVEGIGELLTEALSDPLNDDLAQLSDRTIVDGVSDVDVGVIEVRGAEVKVEGSGAVDVTLTAEGGDLEVDRLSLPFTFRLTLGPDRKAVGEVQIEIDTSPWYGETGDPHLLTRPVVPQAGAAGGS